MAHTETRVSSSTIPRIYEGCSSIKEYDFMGKLGEGTFGEVHKARSRQTGSLVALKKILMHNEKDGFPITALREIKLLKILSHVNVLRLEEMAVERFKGEGRKRAILYMVTPYMDHDLSGLLDNPEVRFTEPQIKCYMLQLLEGLRYLHDSHILHRDMKAANLLINNKGILQIADFGLARHFDEAVPEAGCGGGEARRDYTALVVTRWYRPPELLLGLRRYTTAIDMWGAGCVFGEMFKRRPILAGTSDLNQAQIIFELVGSPNHDSMPGWDRLPGCEGVSNFGQVQGSLGHTFRDQGPLAISLLADLLKLDWRRRINAIDALKHPYFSAEPKPAKPSDLPRFQDSHELDRRNTKGQRAPLPPAPAGGTVGMGPNGEWTGHGHPMPMIGQQWSNGDRGRGWPPDRIASGAPHTGGKSYDNRGYGTYDHRTTAAHPQRHQGRQGNAHPQQSGRQEGRNPLPPPPAEGRHPLPPNPQQFRGQSSGSRVDTYIPAYSDNGVRSRNDNHWREWGDTSQGAAREGHRSSRDPADVSRGDRNRRDDRYRERDRTGPERREFGRDRHSTRSRSPERGNRDRARDRERELYRR